MFLSKLRSFFFILLLVSLAACSSSSLTNSSDTDTGDTGLTGGGDTEPLGIPPTIAKLSPRINSVAESLVPEIPPETLSPSISDFYNLGLAELTTGGGYAMLDYSDEELWLDFISGENNDVVSGVFGDVDESDIVVTRIREVLADLKENLDSMVEADPNLRCQETDDFGGEITWLGAGEDTMTVAFYGEQDNGISGDRRYDCLRTETGENDEHIFEDTVLYGFDDNNVARLVWMSNYYDKLNATTITGRRVVMGVYAEATASTGSGILGYVDLQYNAIDLDGDTFLKTRARITGNALLNDDNTVSFGRGDFTVTSFDSDDNLSRFIGRGGYDEDDYSLFKLSCTRFDPEATTRYFCLQHNTAGDPPDYADPANCTAFEEASVWDTGFPFTITPEVAEIFADNAFFNGDDTDLINVDGSNFVIPTYP